MHSWSFRRRVLRDFLVIALQVTFLHALISYLAKAIGMMRTTPIDFDRNSVISDRLAAIFLPKTAILSNQRHFLKKCSVTLFLFSHIHAPLS